MLARGGCGIMRFDTSLSWLTLKWDKRRSCMSSPQWRFADFRLDPDNACLWRGTQPIALTPKALDVLHYLVTHPDRLVTKDTLLDAVWPETAVSDVVVRIAIGELRRALGDTAQAPRFIATVHRRGGRVFGAAAGGNAGGGGASPPGAPTGCSAGTGGRTPAPHRAVLRSHPLDPAGGAPGPGRPVRGRARLPSDL